MFLKLDCRVYQKLLRSASVLWKYNKCLICSLSRKGLPSGVLLRHLQPPVAEPAQSLRLQAAVDPDEPQRRGPHCCLQTRHQTGRMTKAWSACTQVFLQTIPVHYPLFPSILPHLKTFSYGHSVVGCLDTENAMIETGRHDGSPS